MNYTSRYILGADIGGSHITAAVLDMQEKKILKHSQVRAHLNTNDGAYDILSNWTTVIKQSIDLSGVSVAKVGLAIPGPFDYNAGICYIKGQGKYEQLYGVNVKTQLLKLLNLQADQLFFENDAACFLKGEVFVTEANSEENVLGITLGTGLGSAVAIKNTAQDADLWRASYKDGIAEDYFSSRWFVNRYQELSGFKAKDVKQICEVGDGTKVESLFKEFSVNFANFLQIQVDRYQLDRIIIGGNIAKAAANFIPHLTSKINLPIQVATLGEDSALIGAASIFVNQPTN